MGRRPWEEAERPKDLAVALEVKILDIKAGTQKLDSGLYRIPLPDKGGNPVIPSGAQVPVSTLGPGTYRLVVSASDTAGKTTQRWADFEVQ